MKQRQETKRAWEFAELTDGPTPFKDAREICNRVVICGALVVAAVVPTAITLHGYFTSNLNPLRFSSRCSTLM